ncbi:MAG: hypothetical protein MRJ92_12160 [Nitrospira sp.]|nr:hypothetical protein [Nitrospira sp.]
MEKIKVLIADDHRGAGRPGGHPPRPKTTLTWSEKRRTARKRSEKAKTLEPDVI